MAPSRDLLETALPVGPFLPLDGLLLAARRDIAWPHSADIEVETAVQDVRRRVSALGRSAPGAVGRFRTDDGQPADEAIVASITADDVSTVAAVEIVATAAAAEDIAAVVSGQEVRPTFTAHDVRVAVTCQGVLPTSAAEDVAPVPGKKHVVSVAAAEDVVA